jgi:hypothetical protein
MEHAMGTRGPVPKRSSERRRVNKPETPITSAPSAARSQQRRPSADRTWHPIARGMFDSLAKSGQAAFFEPSDWQTARLAAEATHRLLTAEKFSAMLLSAVDAMWARLLMTEADRRRLRIELEKPDDGSEQAEYDAKVARMAAYRKPRA